jgi:hypothetical protein
MPPHYFPGQTKEQREAARRTCAVWSARGETLPECPDAHCARGTACLKLNEARECLKTHHRTVGEARAERGQKLQLIIAAVQRGSDGKPAMSWDDAKHCVKQAFERAEAGKRGLESIAEIKRNCVIKPMPLWLADDRKQRRRLRRASRDGGSDTSGTDRISDKESPSPGCPNEG